MVLGSGASCKGISVVWSFFACTYIPLSSAHYLRLPLERFDSGAAVGFLRKSMRSVSDPQPLHRRMDRRLYHVIGTWLGCIGKGDIVSVWHLVNPEFFPRFLFAISFNRQSFNWKCSTKNGTEHQIDILALWVPNRQLLKDFYINLLRFNVLSMLLLLRASHIFTLDKKCSTYVKTDPPPVRQYVTNHTSTQNKSGFKGKCHEFLFM